MKITRGRIIGVAAAVAVTAAIGWSLRPKPLVVDTAKIDEHALEATIDADGRTRVRQRYAVVAPVAGRLARISYAEGAAVRAGDIVARLAPVPLDSQMLIQAGARIDATSALVLQAAGQARLATATVEQRRRDLTRATRLVEVGGVSERMVEEARLALAEAEEAARGAAHRARAAEADLAQARAVLIGHEGTSGIVVVRAPASGRILRIADRSERIVAAGTPIMEIGDPMSLEVVIDVLSSDAAAVHPGDIVRLGEWGSSSPEGAVVLDGRVRDIEPSGYTKVSALGVEEQRVNVIVDVASVPPVVGDGFRVEASIIVWSTPKALAVPRGALLPRGDGRAGWTVFVISNGRVETRDVRVGHLAGAAAEVIAGVGKGDEVVLFPPDKILDGSRVKSRRS